MDGRKLMVLAQSGFESDCSAFDMTKTNGQTHSRLLKPEEDLFPPIYKPPPIEWPTEQQIVEVGRRLAAIRQRGAGFEAAGDYFKSGDLAYQLREIIHATAVLFSKSQRGTNS